MDGSSGKLKKNLLTESAEMLETDWWEDELLVTISTQTDGSIFYECVMEAGLSNPQPLCLLWVGAHLPSEQIYHHLPPANPVTGIHEEDSLQNHHKLTALSP
jgi:hypothetical protein